MNDYYNRRNIHAVLMEGFGLEDLQTFCALSDSFRAVYDNWLHRSKNDFVVAMIDYGYRQLKLEELLDWVQKENAARYNQHLPYVNPETTVVTGIGRPLVSVLPDDSLGKGIHFGGTYQGIPLRIAATEWTAYGRQREVRSGWTFIPQWGASHAITFFKIHVYDVGEGYIHIVDVTEPAHPVYLATAAGTRQEMDFHYTENPSAVWGFIWDDRWITK